jgi:hypothetical protein
MTETQWKIIEESTINALESVSSKLSTDSINLINHYIQYDEYEMAFEILFLEIIRLDLRPKLKSNDYETIGEMLNLNNESIFDSEFWNKFMLFCSNH